MGGHCASRSANRLLNNNDSSVINVPKLLKKAEKFFKFPEGSRELAVSPKFWSLSERLKRVGQVCQNEHKSMSTGGQR